MNENLSFNGTLITVNGYDVLDDPGLAQLRRYLPVLAVIAAPYAGLGGDQDPLNPLDRAGEWRALLRMVGAVTAQQSDASTRLALARLDPPTAARLGTALAAGNGGPDAFRVAHLVCHGDRDMLYLEDENGYEAYAVAEQVARLFKNSGARLVLMDGCFSHRIAQLLIDETPVQAVVGTRRRVHPENMQAFTASFYAQLTGGASVRVAYRAGLAALAGAQADRFELITREDVHEITLPLPAARLRAPRPLVIESPVRVIGVPSLPGFVGRRDELRMLAEEGPDVRLRTLHGPPGIGKSWLAAEFAARFGWRFPDGVLWFACNTMTTCAEVMADVARLLDLPPYPAPGEVLAALEGRRVLLVIDGVDALASWAELERIGAWVRDIPAGNCAVLTARNLSDMLPRAGESRSHTVQPFAYKAARTLAMRLAVERDIETLDVDTIDDFLDRTRYWPALIVRGVALVETAGIEPALADLGLLDAGAADPLAAFLVQRFRALASERDNPLTLLIRAQGLPDAFDEGLARVLGATADQVARLVKQGLLSREGDRIVLSPGIGVFVQKQSPLNREQQDQIDQNVLAYLAELWPGQNGAPVPLDRARLNNLRAVIQRQLRPDLTIDLAALARALAVSWRAFVAAGLREEFLAYAQGFRERLPEGVELARLQVAMGEVLDLLPDQEGEAGWAFQMSLRLDGLDIATRTDAAQALGRHLIQVEQVEAAERFLSESLRQLLAQVRRGNVKQAAVLAHGWANALARLDQHTDAVRRYEAALAGYAEAQEAVLSAETQRDLSESLLQLGEIDRAEDGLRRALATAETVGRSDLAGDIRRRLAEIHTERADAEHHVGQRDTERDELNSAEAYLNDALLETLARHDPAALAAISLELGRVLAKLGQFEDAIAHAARSQALLERFGSPADGAWAAVTVGQLHMAHGDSVAAESALYEALDRAITLDDQDLVAHAAGVLVRVHQIRARRAPGAGREFRQYTLDQASSARARFIDLGLGEQANALGEVILALTR